jgi:cell division transport system permease protein
MANILYFFREGARGFYQAKLMTFVSIVTIAIVLFIALGIGIGILNIRLLFTSAVEKADFVVYVNETTAADSSALAGLVTAVRLFPQVKNALLVDKDASWKRFASLYGQEILAAVEGNPLPVSIEISLKKEYLSDPSAKELAADLSSLGGVENVRYAREWMAFLSRFQHWFYWTVVILSLLMIITLHLTISNTIKLTIYARRELVQTMRLVGATRFFIAMPFIVEGVLQGLIGGVMAALAFIILKVSIPSAFPLFFGPIYVPAAPLVAGMLFGWIGSSAAVRKFLK